MKTEVFVNNCGNAATIIRSGGLVAVPTETVYGLAGNGLNEQAVERIYEVKGRPAVKPLSLMVRGVDAIDIYCNNVCSAARALAEKFWPGPLTIVLESKDCVPEIVRAGGTTVGLRCPSNELTLEVLRQAAVPFAAPSANLSGEASPKTAREVLHYFDGKIDGVIDGGPCDIGFESTIIDMSTVPYRILRQGSLSEKEINDALVDHLSILGITGPSGSGKTTALCALETEGYFIIDCDAVYRELLASSEPLNSELSSCFPASVINGRVDRKLLGGIVFTNEAALMQLNQISHRYITDKVRDLLLNYALHGGTKVAIDASELIGSPIQPLCSCVIAIVAADDVRLARIMARDKIDQASVLARMNSQHDITYYKENSNIFLENNGDKKDFTENFIKLIKEV